MGACLLNITAHFPLTCQPVYGDGGNVRILEQPEGGAVSPGEVKCASTTARLSTSPAGRLVMLGGTSRPEQCLACRFIANMRTEQLYVYEDGVALAICWWRRLDFGHEWLLGDVRWCEAWARRYDHECVAAVWRPAHRQHRWTRRWCEAPCRGLRENHADAGTSVRGRRALSGAVCMPSTSGTQQRCR